MENIKQININICIYCFLNKMVNNKNCDPNRIMIGTKSYKNIYIYCIGYILIKYHVNVYCRNPLYFIIDKAYGYIERNHGNKYFIFVSTDTNKEVLRKYAELWNKIENLIETINTKPGDYDEESMRIKFNSDDNILLNNILAH